MICVIVDIVKNGSVPLGVEFCVFDSWNTSKFAIAMNARGHSRVRKCTEKVPAANLSELNLDVPSIHGMSVWQLMFKFVEWRQFRQSTEVERNLVTERFR